MQLDELEKELEKIELPDQIILNKATTITDPKNFIETHISILRANSGKRRFKPYYDRLLEVYNKLNYKPKK